MMKHNSTMKPEENSPSVSITTTPSKFRVSTSSKSKNLAKTEILNGGVSISPSPQSRRANSVPPRDAIHNSSSSQKNNRRSVLNNRPKSGEACAAGSQNGREFEDVKPVNRSVNRAVVESFARPTRNSKKRSDIDLVDVQKGLELDQKENLIRELQSELLELKAELGRSQSLNVELQSKNKKLSEDLALAKAKNTVLTTTKKEKDLVAEIPSSNFKDIQKLIAKQLESSITRKDNTIETSTKIAPSTATKGIVIANVQPKFYDCPSALPPPPPPPLPPRRAAKAASTRKASPVVEMYQSLTTNKVKNPSVGGNYSKQISSSAHNSIVGEIQNRSAHLLAIKSDIETRGEFIEGLIQKVLAAAYQDIEDVLQLVDWLDNELSSLADERAVLRHFQWPEKKADAMREAAIEKETYLLQVAAKSGSSFRLSATPVTIFAHLLVIAVTTLVLVWLLHFRAGLAFESRIKEKIFNMHPLMMAIGFVLVAGEAIMSYKTVAAERETQKIVHLILHTLALTCGIIGIYAVFKFHNELSIPNMYTLHSWIGMSTFCLFGLQFLFAFFSFVFPGADSGTRCTH